MNEDLAALEAFIADGGDVGSILLAEVELVP